MDRERRYRGHRYIFGKAPNSRLVSQRYQNIISIWPEIDADQRESFGYLYSQQFDDGGRVLMLLSSQFAPPQQEIPRWPEQFTWAIPEQDATSYLLLGVKRKFEPDQTP